MNLIKITDLDENINYINPDHIVYIRRPKYKISNALIRLSTKEDIHVTQKEYEQLTVPTPSTINDNGPRRSRPTLDL